MITLATLPQATEQEVFDQVVTHLRKQNVVSRGPDQCMYRGPNGLMCAAGCLIADDEFVKRMDDGGDTSWGGLVSEGLFPEDHKELIEKFQSVHDEWRVDEWEDQFKRLAEEHELKYEEKV